MFDATVSGDAASTGTGTATSDRLCCRSTIKDATVPQITPKTTEADYDRIKAATAAT